MTIARTASALIAALALGAAGCGEEEGGPGSDEQLPEASGMVDGHPAVKAEGEEEAENFCDAAQVDWPYGDAAAVTFDIPGEGDLVCTAPD